MSSPVECCFVRHAIGRDPESGVIPVFPRTGSSGALNLLRTAALSEALARAAQMFAIPNVVVSNGSWVVYKVNSDMQTCRMVATPPNQTAAEMWMIHRGE